MGSGTISYKCMSIFFLVLLLGYFAITSSHDAQGSTETECSLQTFSPEECPQYSSEEETNTIGDDDDSGNIEEQIPSVIPFP